jgi:uncharacterized protein (TIGR02271 family)
MNAVQQGMIVYDANGPIGTVQAVEDDAQSGNKRIVVQTTDGEQQTLGAGMYTVEGDTVHIHGTSDIAASRGQSTWDNTLSGSLSPTGSDAPGEEIVVPVIREEATVRTRTVERGGVRVHKHVNEREETISQPVSRERVHVERVPIGRVVDTAPEVREEGDTLVIPVLEEVLVVEKRLMLKEEIRITRHRSEETEETRVVLREEEVTIEEIEPEINDRQAGRASDMPL